MKDELLKYFPLKINNALNDLSDDIWLKLEEIRVGIDKPVIICAGESSSFLENVFTDENDIKYIIEKITEGSIYAAIDKIKNGYITLPQGHRVGLTGTTVLENDEIKYIKNISSLNFRIRRQIKGASESIIPYILKNKIIQNTLILSPPRCGKTTLIRDLARVLASDKYKYKVSIVDERGEIAAMHNGIAQNDVGIYSNVMDFCPKSQGIMLLIRAMSPDVIITDEIGGVNDANALYEASRCGVKVITTIHGYDMCDVPSEYKKFFELFIILSNKNGAGTIEKIAEADERYA